MKALILAAAAFSIASLASAHPAKAADMVYIEGPSYYSRGWAEPAYVVRPCPVDILCYIRAYPGFRGDPVYAGCRTVSVRERRPDGTVVIRRATTC